MKKKRHDMIQTLIKKKKKNVKEKEKSKEKSN